MGLTLWAAPALLHQGEPNWGATQSLLVPHTQGLLCCLLHPLPHNVSVQPTVF